MSWVPANTARKARRLAEQAGHDLSRLDTGGEAAISSCRTPGCKVMLEIAGPDCWRYINLGEPAESCAFGRGTPGYNETGWIRPLAMPGSGGAS